LSPSQSPHTVSLHDALPISNQQGIALPGDGQHGSGTPGLPTGSTTGPGEDGTDADGADVDLTDPTTLFDPGTAVGAENEQGPPRSEEHTSELQSRFDLVCRL